PYDFAPLRLPRSSQPSPSLAWMRPRPPSPTLFPSRRSSDLASTSSLRRTLYSASTSTTTGSTLASLFGSCTAKSDAKVDPVVVLDRKSTRLNSSHSQSSYAACRLKKERKCIECAP